MVKLFFTGIAKRIADMAIQIHGCMGSMKELRVEIYFQDARRYRIFERTSEIQRKVVAEELLKG